MTTALSSTSVAGCVRFVTTTVRCSMIDAEQLGENLRQNQQDLAFIWKKLDEQQADISEIRTELSKIKQEIREDS